MSLKSLSKFASLLDEHFATLGATDVLDFGDGYSRVLRPDRATGTALDHIAKAFAEVLVGSSMARWQHINYHTFSRLFEAIGQLIAHPVILETGSSAHGVNSSMLLASLAQATGGSFSTVDLNPATTQRVATMLAEKFGQNAALQCHCGDSVGFIENFAGSPNVVYLDSYDLNPSQFAESAAHGLREFECLLPKLATPISLILIDDTPRSRDIFRKMVSPEYLNAVDGYLAATGRLPGKGETILEAIQGDKRFQVLDWEYQVLLLYRP